MQYAINAMLFDKVGNEKTLILPAALKRRHIRHLYYSELFM
jgi:hypothetical protein